MAKNTHSADVSHSKTFIENLAESVDEPVFSAAAMSTAAAAPD